jgi:hypothetical protein
MVRNALDNALEHGRCDLAAVDLAYWPVYRDGTKPRNEA